MLRLLQILSNYKIVIYFILLEIIAFTMIFRNVYQGASYFNTSNYFTGKTLTGIHDVKSYFALTYRNQELANENVKLKNQLALLEKLKTIKLETEKDSLRLKQYSYEVAQVINNVASDENGHNYFTIDKGRLHGIREHMGVVSLYGVAGKVRECTPHYSTVTALINKRWKVYSKIKNFNTECYVVWKGGNTAYAELEDISKDRRLKIGDSIVTSSYSDAISKAAFPEGVLVGTIHSIIDTKKEYSIKVKLATDFRSLSYVYVVKDYLMTERDSIQKNYIKHQQ